MAEPAELLAEANRPVSITAAAGCGKTEEIVKAVKIADGRQLILTHTHAGVAALRARLWRYQVPESKYRVDTIAGWAFKYAISYPAMSGLDEPRPSGDEWGKVYDGALALTDYGFLGDVLRATYTGIFVDEYQDCTWAQHNIVMRLAQVLPVRVLGDPLQGIFDFRPDDPLPSWEQDICTIFKPIAKLETPYRWVNNNRELGDWLVEIRDKLLSGRSVDLRQTPVIQWYQWSDDNEIQLCEYMDGKVDGSIVGIHQWPDDAHQTAKHLAGRYESMEEMDCRQLMDTARKLDGAKGSALAILLINFLMNDCCCPKSGLPDYFREVLELIRQSGTDRLPSISDPQLGMAFYRLISHRDLSAIAVISSKMLQEPTIKVYRRELLEEMRGSAEAHATGNYESFLDAAYAARQWTRVHGRKMRKRIVSRTLLIKGQEFDHALILKADSLQDMCNFYVAATRGARSLTVLSTDPIVNYAPEQCREC